MPPRVAPEARAPDSSLGQQVRAALLRLGGSWRTRYFAIRAARILEMHAKEALQVRYCPTGVMGADGLTKLASGTVMGGLRDILHGKPPPIPTATAELALERPSPSAGAVLATAKHYGLLPMATRRRAAEQYAHDLLTTTDKISDVNVAHMLSLWGFARNHSRRNVRPPNAEYVFFRGFRPCLRPRWPMGVVHSDPDVSISGQSLQRLAP